MKNLTGIIAGYLFFTAVYAQIGIGQWQTHNVYNNGVCVTIDGNKVYCGLKEALFSYDYQTGEIEKYTKPDGFAGIGVRATGYSSSSSSVIFVYDDANVDILKKGEIINLPQIKNYSISGDKTIFNVTIVGDSAIICTGFGAVIVDMEKEIIKTDIKFSDDAAFANVKCYDAAVLNNYYYFATSKGVYKVPGTGNIKDLTTWQQLTGIPAGEYNAIASSGGKVYFNYSNYLTNGIDITDTLYSYDGVTINYYEPGWMARIDDISASNGYLCFLSVNEAKIAAADGSPIQHVSGCFNLASKAEVDATGSLWVASGFGGLVQYNGNCILHSLDGPFSKNAWDMQVVNGDIWVAAGGVSTTWNNAFIGEKMYYRQHGDWKWLNIGDFGYHDQATDIHVLVADPSDPSHAYAGSWGTGFYEIKNYNQVTQTLYPSLDSTVATSTLRFRIGGMDMDSKGNIWVSNSNTTNILRKRAPNGTWTTMAPLIGTNATTVAGHVAVDKRDQVWVALPGKGVLVYNPNGGAQRLLRDVFNSGDLPDLNIRAIVADQDGSVWVGTHDGLRVFSASQIFTATNINGQKIVIKDDNGINELLLKETVINDIVVDGGNRKWIATMGTGVRLVSDDGRQIIHSFTAENSPLLSNNVLCIAIDGESGEVYFGTDKGIVSFRSDATDADDNFGDVYAFPNPVKPEYDGPIAIKGMANNAIVKITDIAGNIVFQTQAEGGEAVWNGKRYDGQRPSTGVYLVFCVNEDASQTMITKILLIN